MHPLLDYSDVYQDITKWLESQAFLSSYDYTLNHMLLQAKQSELRVPPKVLLSEFVFHDHHFHDRSSLSRPSTRSLLHIPINYVNTATCVYSVLWNQK